MDSVTGVNPDAARGIPAPHRRTVSPMAIFVDRAAAGQELAAVLEPYRGVAARVFGIPRGGVVVAAEVARHLGMPLRAVVVRKLGAPGHEEFAVGAIAEGVRVISDEALRRDRIPPDELAEVEQRERRELARRGGLFASQVEPLDGLTAIVVDDGIATGATAEAACRALRARGAATIVLAVPVAPARWEPAPDVVDTYVCPHRMPEFWAVGAFYADFTQTEDAEVAALLDGDLGVDR
jgi:putative phosphoribosyl transferase